ncbi:hypothetical protein F0L17_16355 [Streptomyces sp. TRM43335]|uniref:Type A2 lantipeptide n=1 Tax=Streptomyces taklimakanensis TaxID=2569853 RepID=A0A6G2BFH2_9ACTN|nr:hypothetical protein [Streptomyces taklimakanensis]MTE20652.1 hypothetical protein [Streptomyces taklimakanensis]
MREHLETREIDDAELDAVSGGIVSVSGGLAGAALNDAATVVGAVNSLETTQTAQGIAGAAPGLVSGVTGVHVDTTALGR